MYHRFVINGGNIDPENRGIVAYCSVLWRTWQGDKEFEAKLGTIIKWFNGHLHVPAKTMPPTGLFWFKDTAEHIQKSQELADLLKTIKESTAHIVCDDPGEIVYEDKKQIVAKYHRRLKWKCRKVYK